MLLELGREEDAVGEELVRGGWFKIVEARTETEIEVRGFELEIRWIGILFNGNTISLVEFLRER